MIYFETIVAKPIKEIFYCCFYNPEQKTIATK